MSSFENLLEQNKKWALKKYQNDSNFFKKLTKTQNPEILWIGCSDSRVPAEVIVNAEPGEIFNHRNIANQIIHTDFNCLSAIQYAVNILQVKHIIVCGHYNCGGIQVALNNPSINTTITNKWLMHIKHTYRLHQLELDNIFHEPDRINRLAELNVIEQVHSLTHTSIIQQAWNKQEHPRLHGWIYNMNAGLIKPMITLTSETAEIDPIFQYQHEEEIKTHDSQIGKTEISNFKHTQTLKNLKENCFEA